MTDRVARIRKLLKGIETGDPAAVEVISPTTYIQHNIYPTDPFASIDTAGVGRMVRLATDEGRAVRPQLKVGICGEHGGDPRSIDFFHDAGLDYVSCSPFRVPIARLAAAQAALARNGGG